MLHLCCFVLSNGLCTKGFIAVICTWMYINIFCKQYLHKLHLTCTQILGLFGLCLIKACVRYAQIYYFFLYNQWFGILEWFYLTCNRETMHLYGLSLAICNCIDRSLWYQNSINYLALKLLNTPLQQGITKWLIHFMCK